MQIRSDLPLSRKYMPLKLPEDFPIVGGKKHSPAKEPITYLHLHDCLEIGYCHEGSGVFIVEQKVMPFSAGDVSIINNREMHLARSTPDALSVWSFIEVNPAKLLPGAWGEHDVLSIAPFCGPQFPNIFRSDAHPELTAAVRKLAEELAVKKPGYRPVVRGLMLTIMGLLHRFSWPGKGTTPPKTRDATERIMPALEYLAEHYAEEIGVPALAKLSFAENSTFRRVFKQATGRSPQEYLTFLRIQMATSLLENTSLSVLEIAGRVGYPTLSSFNRHFRRLLGCSPRERRRTAVSRTP
jgi:AraC-like DNA-binding protein